MIKKIGTYDVPEWSLCALENGDYEGLNEEETQEVHAFVTSNFPQGYIMDIDWEDSNEFNRYPSFGTRNNNALTRYGESPYLACKTYKVTFYQA